MPSKRLKRILRDTLYKYLTKFGFRMIFNREFLSTATALLDSTNDWCMNLAPKTFNLVVLIDLKKHLTSLII